MPAACRPCHFSLLPTNEIPPSENASAVENFILSVCRKTKNYLTTCLCGRPQVCVTSVLQGNPLHGSAVLSNEYWINERNGTINRQNLTLQYNIKWHWQNNLLNKGGLADHPTINILGNQLFCQCHFILYCTARFWQFMVPFRSLVQYCRARTCSRFLLLLPLSVVSCLSPESRSGRPRGMASRT